MMSTVGTAPRIADGRFFLFVNSYFPFSFFWLVLSWSFTTCRRFSVCCCAVCCVSVGAVAVVGLFLFAAVSCHNLFNLRVHLTRSPAGWLSSSSDLYEGPLAARTLVAWLSVGNLLERFVLN